MRTKFPIKIPAPLHMLIVLSWHGGFRLFTFIVNNLIQYEHLKIHLICELKRALYGIKCVLRIF